MDLLAYQQVISKDDIARINLIDGEYSQGSPTVSPPRSIIRLKTLTQLSSVPRRARGRDRAQVKKEAEQRERDDMAAAIQIRRHKVDEIRRLLKN